MQNQVILQSLKSYVGIDFKTSGFVVGCGSMHDSGNLYEIEKGYPQDIIDAPSELLHHLNGLRFTESAITA